MTPARRYAQTRNETASREQLLVLLLETALRHVRSGAVALEAGRAHDAVSPLTQASDIVIELEATLDRSGAPELAQQLSDVYGFIATRLSRAALVKDPVMVREAERVLVPIVDGFASAVASLAGRGEARVTR